MHCYSSSSPKLKKHLARNDVIRTIQEAFEQGYNNLSISGGEPLLYPYLLPVLEEAKKLKMSTSIISNGSFPESKYKPLEGLVDVIGVSLDGEECLHNEIRQNNRAFEKVSRFIDFSRKLFPKTGIVFSISDQSWESIPEILRYSASKKVDLIQFHPLELAGRAVNQKSIGLSSLNLKKAFILFKLFKDQYDYPIYFDVLNKQLARTHLIPESGMTALVETVDLIVLTHTGQIKPYSYQLPAEWELGNIKNNSLSEIWEIFEQHKLDTFTSWCKKQVEDISELIFSPDRPFQTINQYEIDL